MQPKSIILFFYGYILFFRRHYAIKLFHMEEKKAIKEVGAMRKNYLSAGCLLFYALFDKHKLLVIDEGLREGVCLASMKNIKF